MEFSVLMSIYYKEKPEYFNRCMESIWDEQTAKPDEIVLVQDGSLNKDLYEIINKWKIKLKNKLVIVKIKQNIGLASALNEGLKYCKYELIARMDTDDIAMPYRFEKEIKFMEFHKNIDIVGTFIEEFSDEMNYYKLVSYPLKNEDMFTFFKKRPPLAHVTVMFKKSFFEKAGYYPISGHITNEDTLLWKKGFKNGCNFANIDYIGVKVRITKDFFNRRRNYKKVFWDLRNRIEVIHDLKYDYSAYIYALGIFIVNILPPKLKKIAYKYLRD